MMQKVYLIGSILGIIVFVLILKKIGLIKIKSKQAREASKIKDAQRQQRKVVTTTVLKSDLFKPTYWKSQSKSSLLPEDTAKNLAKKIKKAWGFLNDDEDGIYGVFRSLTNKAQVSQLAFFYLSEYGDDLASVLVDRLNKKELNNVYNIIDNI